MTLRELGSTLERMKAATLTQLAAEMGASPREIEPLLAFWEHRGNVRRCSRPQASGCGTRCRACPLGRGSAPGRKKGGRTGADTRATGRMTAGVATLQSATVYEWVSADHNGSVPETGRFL